MFNSYVWDVYLKAGGNNVVDMFRQNLKEEMSQDYINKIKNLHWVYLPDEKILDLEVVQLQDVKDFIQQRKIDNGNDIDDNSITQNAESENTVDGHELTMEVLSDIYLWLNDNGESTEKKTFIEFIDSLAYYSTIFAIDYPELFVPYYFQFNFNILESIASEFGIELPPIPIKKDYKGRFFYYGEICNALKDFQKKNGLDDYELCAFLYDFAPKYVGGSSSYIIDEDKLPAAKSAFFIGSSKKDSFYTENAGAVTMWQCNPDTRAGDMIVMYLLSPDSAVSSVWRSRSVGFNDPFFYYYRCAYIGNPVQIQKVSLDQMRKDNVLADMWILRKNMQGLNGVELKPSEFNRILDLAKADVPRLKYDIPDNDSEFNRERDVENKLVKPLLERLDYTVSDYVQQLYIEIGNHNHALIPDFVLLPSKSHGRQIAFAVLEAKLSITNQKQLEETITQARSYAKLLGAKYQMIASKEKMWLFSEEDDFAKDIFSADWSGLHDPDKFLQLYKLVGKK